MSDKEAQEDELLALASIFDAEVFSCVADSDSGRTVGGQFAAHLDLPESFHVVLKQGNSDGEEAAAEQPFTLKYLPPIMLNFELPPEYPSRAAPMFTLSCKWLTLDYLSRLCQRLDEIWKENEGEVILFMWTSFLKDDTLDFLHIQSPLDLTNAVDRRSKMPRSESGPPTASAASGGNSTVVGSRTSVCDHRTEQCRATEATEALGKCSSAMAGRTALVAVGEGGHDVRAVQDIAKQELLLPTLLEHDQRQQEQDFLRTLFTCQVCFMEKLGALCLSFAGCGHVYCRDCMRGYFEVQINEGSVQALTCPSPDCESQASPAQVKELVSSDQFQRYDRLLLQSSLDTMADIVYCPRKPCGCAVMVDESHGMGSCPACHYTFCIYCKLTYHGISPCKIRANDVIRLRDEYNQANARRKTEMERRYGRRAMQQIIEESYSTEYLERAARKCPHCQTWIQKIDGCNKMTCTKCRTYFCWLCLSRLPKQNPYVHFNMPGAPCFNQLFQGVQIDDDDDEDPNFELDEESDSEDDVHFFLRN